MYEVIKANSFGERMHVLTIENDFIQFNDVVLLREEITEIKYSISALQFYRFSVGRRYHIGFRTKSAQIDLIFRSYLKIGNTYFNNLCDRILDEVWEPITDRIWSNYIHLLLKGESVDIGNCTLSKSGLVLSKNLLFQNKQQFIPWDNLRFEKKYDRLTLSDTNDPTAWSNLYYQGTWNIDILISLLDWITKEGGLMELNEQHH